MSGILDPNDPGLEPITPPAGTEPTEVNPPAPEPDPAQERIDQAVKARLAREQRKHERELESLRLENQRLKAAPAPAPEPPAPSGAPDPNDPKFQDPADYFRALARHEAQETLRQERERDRQEREKQTNQQRMSAWQERENAAMTRHEDYEDVADMGHLQRNGALSPAMASAIVASDHGPELLYLLGKNTEEAQRIASLPPELALLALGRMEARLDTTKPTKPTITGAPPPIKPVTGGTGGGALDPSKMSDEEYLAHRRAEYQQRRAAS